MPPNRFELVRRIDEGVQRLQQEAKWQHKALEALLAQLEPLPAVALIICWGTPSPKLIKPQQYNVILFKENNMPATLNPGQTVSFTVAPVNAQGGPSTATLSNLSFATSDATVFSVAPDPNNANGGIVTALTPAVTPDAAVLTASATATEPDGVTTESITGSDTVTVVTTPPPPPPPPVAASLAITFGTPSKRR